MLFDEVLECVRDLLPRIHLSRMAMDVMRVGALDRVAHEIDEASLRCDTRDPLRDPLYLRPARVVRGRFAAELVGARPGEEGSVPVDPEMPVHGGIEEVRLFGAHGR